MAKIALNLPMIQNWSCHNCGGCCTQHAIHVTAEERRRIEGQGWERDPAVGKEPGELFVEEGGWLTKPWTRLAHQSDGSCVFLNEQGLCRIHAKFGEDAKPLACRIYPYAFHPAGNNMTVSLRFSCPSVAANLGKNVTQNKKDIEELARLTTPVNYRDSPPPKLKSDTPFAWRDVLLVAERLDELLADDHSPFELTLLRSLRAIGLLNQARFARIQGPRVKELVDIIFDSMPEEVPEVPQSKDIGRISQTSFRLLVAQYSRLENFKQLTWSHRWRLARAAMRFAQGRGETVPLHPELKAVPFRDIEATNFGTLDDDSIAILRRLIRVKIQGMHFCGRPFYQYTLVEGWWALVLLVVSIVYLARWIALGNGRSQLTKNDVLLAITIADHHHGYSPSLGAASAKQRVRTLAAKGDLEELVVRYLKTGPLLAPPNSLAAQMEHPPK